MKTTVVERYRLLRGIVWVIKLLAVLSLVGGAAAIYLIKTQNPILPAPELPTPWPYAAIATAAVVLFVILWGIGEIVSVLIDLEENTRATRQLLERQTD